MPMEAEGNRNIDCSAGPCCSRLIPAPEFLLVDLVHKDLVGAGGGWGLGWRLG